MVVSSRLHVVPSEGHGARLDQHLARFFPDLSRSRLKALIDAGHVRVNGISAKAARRLRGGERVEVLVPPPAEVGIVGEDLALSIVFEDSDLVVLNKAPGMVVHPGAGHRSGTMVNALLFRLADLQGVGGELRPGIVHRLDKDTSGCLVVAKNERTLTGLQAAFKSRQVEKTYLALVHGRTPVGGTFDTFYGRHPVHRQRFTGKVAAGKRAVTRYRICELFEEASFVEVDLQTGRTHQIRVHFFEAGHPLLGDALYGRGRAKREHTRTHEAEVALGRQALHAARLSFVHPRSGKRMKFEAPIPDDFQSALDVLRRPTTRQR